MTEKIQKFFVSLITPNPARDWAIALVLLLLFFFGLVGYAGYLFVGIRAGTIVGKAEAVSAVLPNVSRADLMNTLEVYRVRRANFESGQF
ncbi:hypothetical protein K2X83_01660 [Patescibacteria group bacterium]|nr:hypothetical protein [Patescibacteria group bacterium]